jgi:hypothetical protein
MNKAPCGILKRYGCCYWSCGNVDNGVAHNEPVPVWKIPPAVHGVVHKRLAVESWSAALKANLEVVFHVSTVIHSAARSFWGAVVNSRPQCAKDEDGCGYPLRLSTSPRGRILIHRLSRCYAPLIHGLSTILWINGGSRESKINGPGSGIFEGRIRSPLIRLTTRRERGWAYSSSVIVKRR